MILRHHPGQPNVTFSSNLKKMGLLAQWTFLAFVNTRGSIPWTKKIKTHTHTHTHTRVEERLHIVNLLRGSHLSSRCCVPSYDEEMMQAVPVYICYRISFSVTFSPSIAVALPPPSNGKGGLVLSRVTHRSVWILPSNGPCIPSSPQAYPVLLSTVSPLLRQNILSLRTQLSGWEFDRMHKTLDWSPGYKE